MLQRSLLILGIIREVIVCKLLLAEKNQAAVIFVVELDRCMCVKRVTAESESNSCNILARNYTELEVSNPAQQAEIGRKTWNR